MRIFVFFQGLRLGWELWHSGSVFKTEVSLAPVERACVRGNRSTVQGHNVAGLSRSSVRGSLRGLNRWRGRLGSSVGRAED